jgi:DNA-binding transcriptional regulator LsrR (DeoR family)
MTLAQFAKAIEDGDAQVAEYVRGTSPGPVAAELGISRQRLHELLTEGKLDALRLVDAKGSLVAILIPDRAVRERHRFLRARARRVA